jgi:hypothetical protein
MLKRNVLLVLSLIAFCSQKSTAQYIQLTKERLQPIQAYMSLEKLDVKKVVKITKDSTVKEIDEPTFVKIKESNFKNGTIEVKVLSRFLKTAKKYDRGFIGIAFRINEDNSKFECIYIRPDNGRAEDQVRRNHSTQYFSYPDYKFDRLRKEAPEKYESYTDMGMNEWITMRIEVAGQKAELYINNAKQPSLIVTDLKHGSNLSGSVALFIEVGTEGYFRDLKIIHKN